jgi:hypothetical protein
MRFQIPIGLLVLFACTVLSADPVVTAMRVPDGGVYPQAQADSRGRVHVIYFKGDPLRGDIFYVRSDDGGRTFTPPIRVNSQPASAAIVGIVGGPHLAVGRGDRVHVAWMGSDKAEPKARGSAISMLYARLNDAGDAFEPQRNVIQNNPGLDGGGSVAADRDGNVYVAWHAPNGGSREEDRAVWIARSHDDGKTFDVETPAFEKRLGVCECCGMHIFAADKGRVFIVFRSAHEKVNRDIHLLASNDYAKTFADAAVDPWKVGVCVMSTASFAQRGDDVLGVWETEQQVRLVRFGSAVRNAPASMPGQGNKRKHPSVAANARGGYVVAWTEGTGWNKGGAVVWQVFDAQGRALLDGAGRADDLPTWSVPAAFAAPDGTFKVLY